MTALKKRAHVRFNVYWRAAVFTAGQGGEKASPAKILDISLGGASLQTELALRVGSVYRVAMAIPSFDGGEVKYIEGQYRVINSFFSAGANRVGLKKEAMKKEMEQMLLWFLREEAKRLEWAYSKSSGRYEFVKESY